MPPLTINAFKIPQVLKVPRSYTGQKHALDPGLIFPAPSPCMLAAGGEVTAVKGTVWQ